MMTKMMMMMMKTMFIVLIRRCQGMWLIGYRCPVKTEQRIGLSFFFFLFLPSAVIVIFITIIIMISFVVMFTASFISQVHFIWVCAGFPVVWWYHVGILPEKKKRMLQASVIVIVVCFFSTVHSIVVFHLSLENTVSQWQQEGEMMMQSICVFKCVKMCVQCHCISEFL